VKRERERERRSFNCLTN